MVVSRSLLKVGKVEVWIHYSLLSTSVSVEKFL